MYILFLTLLDLGRIIGESHFTVRYWAEIFFGLVRMYKKKWSLKADAVDLMTALEGWLVRSESIPSTGRA